MKNKKIRWADGLNEPPGSITVAAPGINFSAKFDPDAEYDVSPETAGRLIGSGLFVAAEKTKPKKTAAEKNAEKIEENKKWVQ